MSGALSQHQYAHRQERQLQTKQYSWYWQKKGTVFCCYSFNRRHEQENIRVGFSSYPSRFSSPLRPSGSSNQFLLKSQVKGLAWKHALCSSPTVVGAAQCVHTGCCRLSTPCSYKGTGCCIPADTSPFVLDQCCIAAIPSWVAVAQQSMLQQGTCTSKSNSI